jgi:hypothetical protein
LHSAKTLEDSIDDRDVVLGDQSAAAHDGAPVIV